MTRSGHILAGLLFAFALLFGAVGGAMAHMDLQAGPSDHHHGETREGLHKAALTMAASCCPAAEAPATDKLPAPAHWAEAP